MASTPSTGPISAEVLFFLRCWVRLSSAIAARTIPLPELTAELSQLDFKISLRAQKVIGPIEKLAPELTDGAATQMHSVFVFLIVRGKRQFGTLFLGRFLKAKTAPLS